MKIDVKTQDTREAVRAAWNGIAPGYDDHVTPSHFWLGELGVRRAGLRPGMRFLDVAAGSGALSLPAARLGAEVTAVDIAPAMLERLAARARAEGLRIETRAGDGHALDLPDGGFDMAGSQFGVMLFPEPERGIGELARVTKRGGRVLMTVYGDPHRIEFFAFFVRAIGAVVPGFTGPPLDPPPLPFQFQDPAKLRRSLAAAGLTDIRVDTVVESLEFRSGDALWDWLTNSNPIVGAVLGELALAPDQTAAIRDALQRVLQERAGGSGLARLTNPINIGIGTK
jgi:ubiquinone/menaquinone biosynthesis C-methylase UbiE